MTGGSVVEVNLENERFSVVFKFKLSLRKFHICIWQITSKNCAARSAYAARIFFLIQLIILLYRI